MLILFWQCFMFHKKRFTMKFTHYGKSTITVIQTNSTTASIKYSLFSTTGFLNWVSLLFSFSLTTLRLPLSTNELAANISSRKGPFPYLILIYTCMQEILYKAGFTGLVLQQGFTGLILQHKNLQQLYTSSNGEHSPYPAFSNI